MTEVFKHKEEALKLIEKINQEGKKYDPKLTEETVVDLKTRLITGFQYKVTY